MTDYKERLNILSLKELKQFIKVYNLHKKIVMTKKKKDDLINEVLKHTELRNGVIYKKGDKVADEPQHIAPLPRPKRAPRKRAQPEPEPPAEVEDFLNKKLKPKKEQPEITLDEALNFVEDFNEDVPVVDFIKKPIARKAYMIYILEKHKNDCLILGTNDIDNLRWRFIDGEIYLNYSGDTLKIQLKKFENAIIDCINAKKRFIAIPLSIRYYDSKHANMIILDLEKMTAERFEPHGPVFTSRSQPPILQESINDQLRAIFEFGMENYKFKYLEPYQVCAKFTPELIKKIDGLQPLSKYSRRKQKDKIGYQTFENLDRTRTEGGYCIAWSFFYLDSRLSAPNKTPAEIQTYMFSKLKSNPERFLSFIRGYAKFLGEFYKKMYDDFIEKHPQFKPFRDALYYGYDKDKKDLSKKIISKIGKVEKKKLENEFDKFLNDMLIKVAGKGTLNE
jgi:hypothetical protein